MRYQTIIISILCLIIFSLNILDICTTYTILNRGIGREANPIFQYMNTTGLGLFEVISKLAVVGILGISSLITDYLLNTVFTKFKYKKVCQIILYFCLWYLVALYSWVVTNNFIILRWWLNT